MLLNVLMSKRDLRNHIFELGKWHLSAINSALIWISFIFLSFLRISIIQENIGNWNHLIFSSSEKLSSIIRSASFIRMRKVFSWYLPLNHRQKCREDSKPSCCWQRSITSEPGPVSCSTITPPFQNSAEPPTSRDFFSWSSWLFCGFDNQTVKRFLIYVKSKC